MTGLLIGPGVANAAALGNTPVTLVGGTDGTSVYGLKTDNAGALVLSSGTAGAVTITGPLGRRSDATSVSVALSTEDVALLPASLGAKTSAASFSVVPASDAIFATSAPLGGAYTDRSIASLAGTSETLMAANTSRRVLIVSNAGGTAIAVNLTGGTAVLNGAGCITLAAGGNLVLDTYPPTALVKVIGTAAAAVTAYEG